MDLDAIITAVVEQAEQMGLYPLPSKPDDASLCYSSLAAGLLPRIDEAGTVHFELLEELRAAGLDVEFVDPSMIFGMLFGSELFEPIVGEFLIASATSKGRELSEKEVRGARSQALEGYRWRVSRLVQLGAATDDCDAYAEATQRVVGKVLDSADQRRLIDEAIEGLDFSALERGRG
jgi:hypothetical protein